MRGTIQEIDLSSQVKTGDTDDRASGWHGCATSGRGPGCPDSDKRSVNGHAVAARSCAQSATAAPPDGVEFQILGPLRATVGGQPVKVGGRRARLLLAALLLDPGRVVPVHRLVDMLWQDRPPASARTQVAIVVSALRRAFREAGCRREVIGTTSFGYVVHAEAAELDAQCALRLVTRARDMAAAGDGRAAAALLREALVLWHGPVLNGVEGTVAAAGARYWEGLRLAAAEELAEAELSLGRHREHVGEIAVLVADHPYRERLRALLMTALVHSGRQAEALAVYHEGRALLDEELGLEPGRGLRDLHTAILRDEVPFRRRAGTGDLPGAHRCYAVTTS